MRYALIEIKTNAIVKFKTGPFANATPDDPAIPKVSHKGWKWLPVVDAAPIRFDPASQVREGPSYAVGRDKVVESYKVRDKTPAELDAEMETRLPGKGSCHFYVMLDQENRIRALEKKDPLSADDYRSLLKKAL